MLVVWDKGISHFRENTKTASSVGRVGSSSEKIPLNTSLQEKLVPLHILHKTTFERRHSWPPSFMLPVAFKSCSTIFQSVFSLSVSHL